MKKEELNSRSNVDSVGWQDHFFGQNLRRLRKSKGMSQERLAKKLGVTRTTVANYEAGRASPPFWLVRRAANYYGVEMSVLFQKEKEEETSALGKGEESHEDVPCQN